MKRKLHQRLAVLAILACLVLISACGSGGTDPSVSSSAAVDQEECILVGRVVPITGPLASFGSGTPFVEQQAIDYINDVLGGIYMSDLGRKLPIRLVHADSESSLTKASEAAVRLIQEEFIDIMVVSNTADTVCPVSTVCERYGIPCISVDAPADVWLAGGPYTYSFHAFFNTENELNCFMDAWDQLDSNKQVGLVAPDDLEGLEIATRLPEMAIGRGYNVVDPGRFAVGAKNYGQLIRQLKGSGCQIIAGVMNAPDFAVFWRQCAELNYQPKISTIAKANLFAEDVAALGRLGDGLITEVWWAPDFPGISSLTGWNGKELADKYQVATNLENVPATIGYKHANIELLYDILSRAASVEAEKVVAAIRETELETLVGLIRFDAQNICIMPCLTGQWSVTDDGRAELKIVANTQKPDVTVNGPVRRHFPSASTLSGD